MNWEHPVRVALFTDSYDEMNGVALTCRQFHSYASRRGLPFLLFKNGRRDAQCWRGRSGLCQFAPSPVSFPVDTDLRFDLLFLRRLERVRRNLRIFQPDVIHITSPGDVGILGVLAAYERKTLLAASWHTNLHEFAERRIESAVHWLPRRWTEALSRQARDRVLDRVLWFYGLAHLLFAPNAELAGCLSRHTGKPVHQMIRGVDRSLFHPGRRTRRDSTVVIGYAGRIVPEKGVRLLVETEKELLRAGVRDYRFLILGQGGDRPWLESQLAKAVFPGVLKGEALAQAYANMDIFAFPSRTDTFGNAVQEALACGVPAVVTDQGGPQCLVTDGVTGFVTNSDRDFCERVALLASQPTLLARMKDRVRREARLTSWDSVFQQVYAAYRAALRPSLPAASTNGLSSVFGGGRLAQPVMSVR